MYRNYMTNRNCCCNGCSDKKDTDIIDKTCNNVKNMFEDKNMCECGFDEENNVFPNNPMFAQSYVPWQTMNKTFVPDVGLKMGTIFPEPLSPYMPGQSKEEIVFIKKTNKIGKGCNKC